MGRVRRWQQRNGASRPPLPPDLFLETVEYEETRAYGRKVFGAAEIYRLLYSGGH
jgi:soluble lytic murein transglycosylase